MRRKMQVVPIGPHCQEADASPMQDDGIGAAPCEGFRGGGGAGVEGIVEHLLGLLVLGCGKGVDKGHNTVCSMVLLVLNGTLW